MSSTDNTAVILMSLRPREQYYQAAEQMGMTIVKLDPPDVIKTITGPKTLSAINEALHEASLNLLKSSEKGNRILLDFSPIRTIAVEGMYGLYVGEMDTADIDGYKHDWKEKWLPVLEDAGYDKVVVLADIADVGILDKVAEQQGKAKEVGFTPRQMPPEKKNGYLDAIAEYHAAMVQMSTAYLPNMCEESILDAYGFQHMSFLANETDTPLAALHKCFAMRYMDTANDNTRL